VPYITRQDAISALTKLKDFHRELDQLYLRYGISLESNSGRRNVVLSQAQEEFFAAEIAKRYDDVVANGKTGQPDIVLGQLGVELECKLTSPSNSGQVTMQADEYSVSDVPKDFLYVVSDEMQRFAVFHFVGLTREDFSKSPGARSKGKVRLLKSRAQPKCRILVGGMENRKSRMIESITDSLETVSVRARKKADGLRKRLEFWEKSEDSYTIQYEEV